MVLRPVRPAAFAGSWYPGNRDDLRRAVDRYLVRSFLRADDLVALVAPHAGIMYSGPVAGHAYGAVVGRSYEAIVLIGPSHRVAFDGVAVYARGSFDTPFGPVPVHETLASTLLEKSDSMRDMPEVHAREHCLEMQLPFLARVLPATPIVPLLIGDQRREVIDDVARALSSTFAGRQALLVASSDLSHYNDAVTAARLDGRVTALVGSYDADGLMTALEHCPEHACGGGAIVAVMRAASALGARHARVLARADSGDVSGDKEAVVGYMAAAFGRFDTGPAD